MKRKTKVSIPEELTQGLVFYGIRSSYYDKPCYGIVITARCDLAQLKVKQVHYLTAVSLNDWVRQDCLNMILDENIRSCKKTVSRWMKEKQLNTNLIDVLGPTKLIKIVNEYETKHSKSSSILQALDDWILCHDIQQEKISKQDIVSLLNDKFAKRKKEKINLIINNNLTGYYFIPGEEIGADEAGYVINLRDINQVDMSTLYRVISGEIDGLKLSNEDRKELSHVFYLDSANDFSFPTATISSPRIEHILQSFSQVFCRIGMDDLDEDFVEEMKNLAVGIN